MKKTLNVNIGGVAFVIDEDAYTILKHYLDDIEARFEDDVREESIVDVEVRIAELLSSQVHSERQVITVEMVRFAMKTVGSASYFGERKEERQSPPPHKGMKRLLRSRTDRVLGGVCGGLAQYTNIDPLIVRLVAVFLCLPGLLSFWVYIIAWIIIPEEQ